MSRATIKAQMLRMGEPVAFGSDADVVDELAQALTEARAEIERLNAQVDEALRSCLAEREGRLKAEAAIATLRARVREVVGPFVSHYAPWMDEHDPETQSSTFPRHTFAQLNAARQLMEEVK